MISIKSKIKESTSKNECEVGCCSGRTGSQSKGKAEHKAKEGKNKRDRTHKLPCVDIVSPHMGWVSAAHWRFCFSRKSGQDARVDVVWIRPRIGKRTRTAVCGAHYSKFRIPRTERGHQPASIGDWLSRSLLASATMSQIGHNLKLSLHILSRW